MANLSWLLLRGFEISICCVFCFTILHLLIWLSKPLSDGHLISAGQQASMNGNIPILPPTRCSPLGGKVCWDGRAHKDNALMMLQSLFWHKKSEGPSKGQFTSPWASGISNYTSSTSWTGWCKCIIMILLHVYNYYLYIYVLVVWCRNRMMENNRRWNNHRSSIIFDILHLKQCCGMYPQSWCKWSDS